jgi:two-component system, OmpR family, heavy metal sensor histidine kinase CusS
MIQLLQSFRVRLILLMVLLSGLALVAFGWVTWGVVFKEKIQQLDLSLEKNAVRYSEHFLLESYRLSGHQIKVDELVSMQGLLNSGIEFLLLRQDGKIVNASSDWPGGILLEEFSSKARGITGPLDEYRPTPYLGQDRNGIGPPPPWGDDDQQPPPRGDEIGRRALPPSGEDSGLPAPRDQFDDRPSPREGRKGPPSREGPKGGPERRDDGPRSHLMIDRLFHGTVNTDSGTWRIVGIPAEAHVVLFTQSTNSIKADMRGLLKAFLFALPIALLFIAAGAYWIANQALLPVQRLTFSAESITVQGLDKRLPVEKNPREFSHLVRVYNDMLARLELSFNQASRFSADAAHELNTPLTILMGHLDDALQSATPDSEEQSQFGLLLEEVQRLRDIIDKLLLLSRADSGQIKHFRKRFCISNMIFEISEDARELAPELALTLNIVPDVHIDGDEELLRQAVFNLLSNAIKYNQSGGFIGMDLTVNREEGLLFLSVSNSGNQIPAAAANHIFDRFFRADPSRNRSVSGLGLGLPLAKEFIELHGGTLSLSDNRDGHISFTLQLPVQLN